MSFPSDLLVLSQGAYGDAVATALARDHEVRVAPLATDPLDALLDGVDLVVVASWTCELAGCERVAAACARAGVPWSRVGGCARCLDRGDPDGLHVALEEIFLGSLLR